jgi:hypothetical protein
MVLLLFFKERNEVTEPFWAYPAVFSAVILAQVGIGYKVRRRSQQQFGNKLFASIFQSRGNRESQFPIASLNLQFKGVRR